MNTAITSIPISPSSPGSVIHRAVLAITAWMKPRRRPLTREDLVEIVEMRRMAERLREEGATQFAQAGRVLG
jgi:hypothetical protein